VRGDFEAACTGIFRDVYPDRDDVYIRDRVLDHLHLAEEWMLETYQSEIDILSEIDFDTSGTHFIGSALSVVASRTPHVWRLLTSILFGEEKTPVDE